MGQQDCPNAELKVGLYIIIGANGNEARKPGSGFTRLRPKNIVALMTSAKAVFFELADEYARTRHQCFLAEMDLRTIEIGYNVCFRPLEVTENSDPYACKYLTVPTEQVEFTGRRGHLPGALVDRLDAALSELKRQG
jgi:hypothetical protein